MSYTRAQRGVSFWFVSKKKQPVSLVGLESERSELLEKFFGLAIFGPAPLLPLSSAVASLPAIAPGPTTPATTPNSRPA